MSATVEVRNDTTSQDSGRACGFCTRAATCVGDIVPSCGSVDHGSSGVGICLEHLSLFVERRGVFPSERPCSDCGHYGHSTMQNIRDLTTRQENP